MLWKKGKNKVGSEFPLVKWLTKDFRGVRFNESDLTYIFENMDPLVAIFTLVEDEVRIPIWDQDTRVNHFLMLHRDIDGVFGFYDDWIQQVVIRRGFEGKELIGFYVNRLNLDLTFSVIETTNNIRESA
ncbi:hypothetical protein H5410_005322 [Solanum commersonii]|uniref:Uncharacterized protein n=1 Tax=Solanum commersonii TaxID=4109 RepID=A0A9J6A6V1_SOLCO|nr:hypothetical protein H5410_005322 [Solanum commersonii]